MQLAWRGVVDQDGDVIAWPTPLMDHKEAFYKLPWLADYRARWRQWSPDGDIDFDKGVSPEDRAKVIEWIESQS
jgi:hypothetical protein